MHLAGFAWEPYFGFIAGALGIALGVLSARGRYRRWEPWYRNSDNPFYIRNMAFAMIPFGTMLIAGTVAALVSSRSHSLAAALVVVALLAFVIGVAFMIHPPGFLTPAWIKEEPPHTSA
jgi:hypothetical protein